MDNKHTPGPWEAFTEDRFSGWWAIRDTEGNEIGSTDGGFDELDARLMAAAPEMLEALTVARELVSQYYSQVRGYTFSDGIMEVLNRIDDVLDKAEGKQ